MNLLSLLKSKTRCLEKFQTASHEYLEAICNDDYEKVKKYDQRRIAILKTLELFDRKLEESIRILKPGEKTTALIQEVREEEERYKNLLKVVIEMDQGLIQAIESALSELGEKIKDSNQTKNVIGKFKSEWVKSSGSSWDETL